MVQGNSSVGKGIERGLELLVVWVLSASAIGLVCALAGHFLAPQILLAALLVTGAYAWRTKGFLPSAGALPDWRHLVLLTLVCLFFRLPAYNYVLGGQDEGVYVNMANHLVQTGSIKVHDVPLERLAGTPLAETYLAENRHAVYLPGVYTFNHSGARLEFQFYHLFPIWMALFAGAFGSAFGLYALTFFGLLSVLFMYRLALGVSGSGKVALAAGLFLALNPLHAFFSKFPVTEIQALAFSLIGFTYLVELRRPGEMGRRWLWLSALAFGCLFVTRISGFMYLPFVIALAVASTIRDQDVRTRRAMLLWAVAVTLLYALSVRYGLRWSRHYSHDIYRMSFEHLFGHRWQVGLVVSAVLLLAGWLGVALMARSGRLREKLSLCLVGPARKYLGAIVVLALLAGMARIYQLGWTNRFLDDPWLGMQWHLAHAGWTSVKASSLFALLVYLGPLLPAGCLALLARHKDPAIEFLRVFASGFFVYAILLQWTVPYGPYYARYLLSEVVPYLGLFFVLAWWSMDAGALKRAAGWLFGASLLYMGCASAVQLGKSENDHLYGSLQQLLSPVDSGDLVLMTPLQPGWPAVNQIKTPVVYTFGRTAITVSDASLSNRAYIAALDARYDDVFLISSSSVAPDEFEPVGSTRIKIWAFNHSYLFPDDFGVVAQKRLYLYRMGRSLFPLGEVEHFDNRGEWGRFLVDGWSAPESAGTWTSGKHAQLVIDTRQLPRPEHGLRLHFEANALVTPGHPRQRIALSLNGKPVGVRDIVYPRSSLGFDVDISSDLLDTARKLRIDFELPDAASPKLLGLGDDRRTLALGLKSLEAYPLPTGQPPLAVRQSVDNHHEK